MDIFVKLLTIDEPAELSFTVWQMAVGKKELKA